MSLPFHNVNGALVPVAMPVVQEPVKDTSLWGTYKVSVQNTILKPNSSNGYKAFLVVNAVIATFSKILFAAGVFAIYKGIKANNPEMEAQEEKRFTCSLFELSAVSFSVRLVVRAIFLPVTPVGLAIDVALTVGSLYYARKYSE